MRRRSIPTFLLVVCLALCSAGQKTHKRPEHAENNGPVPDARSFIELFTKLELKLDLAVQKKNEASLDAMLAPEFLLRSSMNPETPLSRASWIEKAMANRDIRTTSHDALTIRAFVGVAVVSFVCRQKATVGGKDLPSDYLIVDVWEANHEKWQVGARYMAPVGRKQESTERQYR
jgi:Domain of unknown function (DUF4440)